MLALPVCSSTPTLAATRDNSADFGRPAVLLSSDDDPALHMEQQPLLLRGAYLHSIDEEDGAQDYDQVIDVGLTAVHVAKRHV